MKRFIEAQHVFFVANAPAESSGHVNLSPKGLESLRIIGPASVAYIDYIGSGIETIAHLRQNRRMVIMFCAFEGPPQIVRLHGQGHVVEPQDESFRSLLVHFQSPPDVQLDVERISDSCGYGVPLYRYEGQRSQLGAWAERKGEGALLTYQREKNSVSIDRLPGLRWPEQR